MNIYQQLTIFTVIFYFFIFTSSSYSQDQLQSTIIENPISISTNKDSYVSNDIIYFSGKVNPIISSQSVLITIKDPIYNIVYQKNLIVDNNGYYKGMTMVDYSGWNNSGVYIIEAQYNSSKSTCMFNIKLFHPNISNFTHPSNPATLDMPQSNSVGKFVLSTNKVNYHINDSIIIFGKVDHSDSASQNIHIAVTDSNFSPVYEDFISSDSSGRFTVTIDHGKYLVHPGTFVLTATNEIGTVKLKFTVDDSISEDTGSIPEFSSLVSLILILSTMLVVIITKKIEIKIL